MADIRLVTETVDTQDVITSVLHYEKRWNPDLDLRASIEKLQRLIDTFTCHVKPHESEAERLYQALDILYIEMAFSGTLQDIPESLLSSFSYALDYRTGDSISLGIIITHFLRKAGFDADPVVADNDIFIKVMLPEERFALIEPDTGMQEIFSIKPTNGMTLLEPELTRSIDNKTCMMLFLTRMKMSFMNEDSYEEALSCVELLMDLSPEDPYQHRDRGMLLQRLDCFQLAKQDFQFFIERCPNDPLAEILKIQLDEFEPVDHIVH